MLMKPNIIFFIHPKIKILSSFTHMTLFLLWNTKAESQKTMLVFLVHALKMTGDLSFQALKKDGKA